MCNFYCMLALFITAMGHAAYPPADPGNNVTWGLASIEYLDTSTGEMIYTATQSPSESTGCHLAKFSGNYLTDTFYQVSCDHSGTQVTEQSCDAPL